MKSKLISCFCIAIFATPALAQPPRRVHTANQKRDLKLVRADQDTRAKNSVSTKVGTYYRSIAVNSIPKHKVGRFPNRGNPHFIKSINTNYQVTLSPKRNKKPTPVGMSAFGISVNGILFDPGPAEFYLGQPSTRWQYEALGGAVPLGLDQNFAHVQPNGQYHYHGLPTGLLQSLNVNKDKHSPLIGWAADGHPIYALYGYEKYKDSKSKIKLLKSSYKLKSGNRPKDKRGPGGKYDGTFVNDYEYVEGSGDLDECNGRFTVTPEFPKGTYAYFLTANWPVIPRNFRGTADNSFKKQRGQRGPGGQRGGPQKGRFGKGKKRRGGGR